MSSADFVLMIDLLGTFAFALNGAFTATRTVRLDIVGVLVLGVTTAIGGGIMRDVLVGAVPPSAFTHWYYLAAAGVGALLAFFISRPSRLLTGPILIFDAIGLSLFCVTGALKAMDYGLSPAPAATSRSNGSRPKAAWLWSRRIKTQPEMPPSSTCARTP